MVKTRTKCNDLEKSEYIGLSSYAECRATRTLPLERRSTNGETRDCPPWRSERNVNDSTLQREWTLRFTQANFNALTRLNVGLLRKKYLCLPRRKEVLYINAKIETRPFCLHFNVPRPPNTNVFLYVFDCRRLEDRE